MAVTVGAEVVALKEAPTHPLFMSEAIGGATLTYRLDVLNGAK